jgi:uncharacterized protein with PQ loop repeat
MNSEHIAGWIAFAVTVVYTVLGLPVQIRKNRKNRSTAGLSLVMNVMLLCTFCSWVFYGLVKTPQDWYIVGSNFPGAVCVSILLAQFWKYRDRNSGATHL